jgi:hypothetical protein
MEGKRSRSRSPKRSSPRSPKTSSTPKKDDEKWKGLGQMSVLPVELINVIYKMLPVQPKAQMLQTNNLMKTLLGNKVPEVEKKLYVAEKELFGNLVEISSYTADQYEIPYEGTVPNEEPLIWNFLSNAPGYEKVIVPKKIVDLIEVEENLKNGKIKPVKGKLDTIPKLIKYKNSTTFMKKTNYDRFYINDTKIMGKPNYVNILLTEDIKELLIEYYFNLVDQIEKRLP